MTKGKTIQNIQKKEISWGRIYLSGKTYLVTSNPQRETYFLYEVLENEKLILLNKGKTPVIAKEVLN